VPQQAALSAASAVPLLGAALPAHLVSALLVAPLLSALPSALLVAPLCSALPSALLAAPVLSALLAIPLSATATALLRLRARRRRRYVRARVMPYRGDDASLEQVAAMFEAVHKRLQRRWWRRLLQGQPSLSVEVHCDRQAWLGLAFPEGLEAQVQVALQHAYPSARLCSPPARPGAPPCVLRLKKRAPFTRRAKRFDRFAHERAPAMNALITAMAACGEPAYVQLALTPTPALFDRYAKHAYKRHEARLSRARKLSLPPLDPSLVERAELLGGLEVQHHPLFFADMRVIAPTRRTCERIAAELRAAGAENRLVERGTAIRHGWLGLYKRRTMRGEGNPLPSYRRGVLSSVELASIWHAPSLDYATVPFERSPVPIAPAPPTIMRASGGGTLRDARGRVSIHPAMRRQNTAVPGTVEQGKSSYLVATVAEDLRRERCAVILLDPKGDAADAAVSIVPERRTCTLLDFAHPTCGFDPLAVDAPADTIADYVVGAMKNLFDPGDIKASSDRYLRNAIVAVLAHDRASTLWDAARLLSVGEEGYAYRARVAARLRTRPEMKEISEFFAGELTAQLADARGTTTAKLDAPVNKLARLLNSESIKRVLLNDSLRVSLDEVIANREVLVVKGALGRMGAGNTSVLMQLLVGMLDAALARRQDAGGGREGQVAVALKVDEAPLVLNRGFAETMALKRSAGLETVACWQTDSQWTDRDVRAQLDALFAHRVYFATSSVEDSRHAASLLMASFSDVVRPDVRNLSALGRPDARLHLPRHHAIASWVTERGRQPPFVAQTLPLRVDRCRLEHHARRQAERGGRYLEDLSQPHWERAGESPSGERKARGQREPAEATLAQPSESSGGNLPGDQPQGTEAPGGDPPAGQPRASQSLGGERRARERPAAGAGPEPAPGQPDESYRELVALRGAQSVRWPKPKLSPSKLDPEPLDLEILELLGELRHLLSSQIHRRFNPTRVATTTQRRLKRLADAGLVARFQLHRGDGGGTPMCYALTAAGRELCARRSGPAGAGGDPRAGLAAGLGADADALSGGQAEPMPATSGRTAEQRLLEQALHDVRAAGWALALERALGGARLGLLGPERSPILPPSRPAGEGRRMLALGELALPGGRTPHDFLRTDADGRRVEVERFQSVRPDVTIAAGERGERASRGELLVELDDRLPQGARAAKLERYDHFLTGWSTQLRRYRDGALPQVLFVCRDRARARACARAADQVLTAARAYAGEYPSSWEYTARERIAFAAEPDVYAGVLCAWRTPTLPPDVRAAAGDPAAREPLLREVEIGV
jgi:protein involved in plasmid replication-relaxation